MGFAIVLDSGSDTHFTMVYINGKSASSAEAQTALELVRTFCQSHVAEGVTELPVVPTRMWGARSILIDPESELARLKQAVTAFLHTEHGDAFAVDHDSRRAVTAHINLRGQPAECLLPAVNLVSGWQLL